MTKDKFNEHIRAQIEILEKLAHCAHFSHCYGGGGSDSDLYRALASDLRLIASNLDNVCSVYEMENTLNVRE